MTFDLFDDKNGSYLRLYYENGYTYLDRSAINNGSFPNESIHNITRVLTPLVNGEVKIRVLLDKYSAEVFVADGAGAMSATMLTTSVNEQLKISAANLTSIKISSADIVV